MVQHDDLKVETDGLQPEWRTGLQHGYDVLFKKLNIPDSRQQASSAEDSSATSVLQQVLKMLVSIYGQSYLILSIKLRH